ncbi:uncharacterized protein DDB_G0283697-like [Asparagus officinalis]|uniref:uncharacterized protein DDB_G0283697-like n=1 Tax=Asparagus officinalis TaxID=4686 RepID=UPI00098E1612|nr:uncharacterized protein DDB_G0283697-like [Asparagus officinalis]
MKASVDQLGKGRRDGWIDDEGDNCLQGKKANIKFKDKLISNSSPWDEKCPLREPSGKEANARHGEVRMRPISSKSKAMVVSLPRKKEKIENVKDDKQARVKSRLHSSSVGYEIHRLNSKLVKYEGIADLIDPDDLMKDVEAIMSKRKSSVYSTVKGDDVDCFNYDDVYNIGKETFHIAEDVAQSEHEVDKVDQDEDEEKGGEDKQEEMEEREQEQKEEDKEEDKKKIERRNYLRKIKSRRRKRKIQI